VVQRRYVRLLNGRGPQTVRPFFVRCCMSWSGWGFSCHSLLFTCRTMFIVICWALRETFSKKAVDSSSWRRGLWPRNQSYASWQQPLRIPSVTCCHWTSVVAHRARRFHQSIFVCPRNIRMDMIVHVVYAEQVQLRNYCPLRECESTSQCQLIVHQWRP